MPDNFRFRSSRLSSEGSSSSNSSLHMPQINGLTIASKPSDTRRTSDIQTSSNKIFNKGDSSSSPMRQRGKATATCLMQPFTVLSQSWCNNAIDPGDAVPQWVLDGAQIADDSPRSSIDSLEASGIQLCLDDSPEDSPMPSGPGQRSMPIVVCKAIIASWRQANRPPRWISEASPKLN